jgi:hypothetical protein
MTYSSKYQSAGVNTPWIFCAFFMDLNFRDSVKQTFEWIRYFKKYFPGNIEPSGEWE